MNGKKKRKSGSKNDGQWMCIIIIIVHKMFAALCFSPFHSGVSSGCSFDYQLCRGYAWVRHEHTYFRFLLLLCFFVLPSITTWLFIKLPRTTTTSTASRCRVHSSIVPGICWQENWIKMLCKLIFRKHRSMCCSHTKAQISIILTVDGQAIVVHVITSSTIGSYITNKP